MRTLPLRKAAVTAALTLALGSLAACGNGDTSTTAGGSAGGTSASQPAPGSAVSSADFLALMKTAARQTTTDRVSMTVDVAGQSITMNGAMDLTGDKPAAQMTMDMSSAGIGQVEMRMVDGIVYMKMGSLTHGKWVKFDLSDPNNPLGSLSSTLDNLNPAQMVGQLKPDAFRHVTFVGSDAVGRHYRATLVSAKTNMLKGLPPSAMVNMPKTAAYDVWLDSKGRLAKFKVLMPKAATMTGTYRDYGVDLDIKAPAPSQVTDMSSLGSSMG